MAEKPASATRPADIDRVVNGTITLMSVLLIYDGWRDVRFIGVVVVIVGPMLAVYLSHVFATTLTQEVSLERRVSISERVRIARSESRFLLICVPPVLLLGILVLLGVSIGDAIPFLLLLGMASLGYWGGRAGREAGLMGWRLAWAVLGGLLIGALIVAVYVTLQPGKAVSGGTV